MVALNVFKIHKNIEKYASVKVCKTLEILINRVVNCKINIMSDNNFPKLSVPIIIGIVIIPIIFSWFTLKKDLNKNYIYRKRTRVISLFWMVWSTLSGIARLAGY